MNPLAVARDLSVAAYIYGPPSASKMGLIDLATGTNRWTAESTDLGFSAISFSPDERILATASYNAESKVRFLEAASGKDIGQLEGHRGSVKALLFWPDGSTLASGSSDQTIRLWDMATHQPVGTLGGHRDEVWRLALLPDNTTLVSGCRDGSVRLWDTAKLRSKRTPYVRVTNLSQEWCFSANSKALITLDGKGRVAQWQRPDFQDCQPLLELGTNTVGARLSRDGRLVATGSTNGRVEVWDVQ